MTCETGRRSIFRRDPWFSLLAEKPLTALVFYSAFSELEKEVPAWLPFN